MLRVLTFNTQLRSWMMEVGWPPSLPPVYTAEDRARFIADNILASAHDYDIVCLNEVFADVARDTLSDRLSSKYPYQVTKADLLYTKLRRPGLLHDISNSIFDIVFQPLFDVASVLALKLEDSGLFLASRWPFELLPVPQAVVDLIGVQEAADLFPDGMVAVSFMTYGDCDGGLMADCRAAKGVLWARIRRDSTQSYDIFATHTQADDDKVEEHKDARARQFAAAWDFISNRAGGPPFDNPTIFLGDFNVPSGLADDAGQNPEWNSLFNTPGQPLTDHLVDQWGIVQCRGGGSGLTDPGVTADVRYPPLRQRLDIVAAALGPDLVSQHLYVDEAVWTVPPGVSEVSYLSDHYPLAVDLGRVHPFASPPTAMLAPDVDFDSGDRLLGPGESMWFRYDVLGTYEFRLIADDPAVYFEIYLGDDLSHPRKPFRNEQHPDFGDRYVLVAPFFVKVGSRSRNREFVFGLRSHRHTGVGPDDALYLIPGVPYPETFPGGQQLNNDSSVSPWDDTDTKWFKLLTPRAALDEFTVSVTMQADIDLRLLVARRESDGSATLVDEAPPGSTAELSWSARPDEEFFVCVQRQDGSFPAASFTLLADIDVTLLLGGTTGKPVLLCTKETSGWGADDISIRMKSDSGWSRTVSNDEIGDFEQDSVRSLGQWIDDVVAYQAGFAFTVVEEDDIDADDIGSETFPRFAHLAGWSQWTQIRAHSDGSIEGAVTIVVDDGEYTVRCRITRWHETV